MRRCGVASALLGVWLSLAAGTAAAPSLALDRDREEELPDLTRDSSRYGDFDLQVADGFRDRYWVLGIGAEYFTSAAEDVGSGGEELLGLTAMWRLGAFGPHALIMAKPGVDRVQDTRALAGLGLRGFYEIPGFTELSYGIGGHAELRLTDHFWLGYLTPLEVGAVVWRRGSWNIEAFIGMRRAVVGSLINYFLIDPNGFDNQDAEGNLDEALHGTPWRAFVRLVFGRRVD
ncbi:MAG: hypothetical protein KC766_11355 [Myxococcales bacterium]|nr:hypothetical protein [Myxococcales bacterium]